MCVCVGGGGGGGIRDSCYGEMKNFVAENELWNELGMSGLESRG